MRKNIKIKTVNSGFSYEDLQKLKLGKLRISVTCGLLLFALLSQAQLFKGLGFQPNRAVRELYSDTIDNFIYAGGNFTEVNGTPMLNICYFDGVNWKSMNNNWHGGYVQSIVRFKGKIYFAGNVGIRSWNGSKVDSVKKGVNGGVLDLYNFKDSLLIVAGSFTVVDDSIPALGIATWDGIQWDTLAVNVPRVGSTNDFSSIAFYKNEFYFGGNFTGNFGEDIIRFDGQQWRDVGGSLQGDSWVNAMQVYQNELYVTGDFKKYSGNADNHIMRWNGSVWEAVGGGFDHQAWDLEIFKGQLFAAGVLEHAGGVNANGLAKWDGREWCGYTTNFNNSTGALTVYKDSLVIGNGYFTSPRHEQVQILTDINQTNKCGVLAINELSLSNTSVFPNPVSTSLHIEGLRGGIKTSIQLIDMQGRILLMENTKEKSAEIKLENYKSGIYLLRLVSGRERITKKIIKK